MISLRACSRSPRRAGALAVAGLLAAGLVSVSATVARAGEVKVAVAANFTEAAKEIGALFDKSTGDKAVFSFGSTGNLYSQITQGAPYQVYLAADQARPERAEREGYAVPGTRFTYATGQIVLFSMNPGLVTGADTLKEAKFNKVAICNPVIAPYGAAAVQAMKNLGVYGKLRGKFVTGENISQAYQFVVTGNAEVGFVALSQVVHSHRGSRWIVPRRLYKPIAQDAVLLKTGANDRAARAFIAFLKGPEANAVKKKFGYGIGD